MGLYVLLRRRASESRDGSLPAAADASGWSATHLRFFAAWLLGAAAIVLISVDDGFGALMLPSGLLLCWAGVALARDRREWDRFRAVAFRQTPSGTLPGATWARASFAAGMLIIGAGWTLGGVLGTLALFGEYTFPN